MAESPVTPTPELKPRTNYVCPTGGGLGHSSLYTGAYPLELRRPRDAFCDCGEAFIEEDSDLWRLTWEMRQPGQDWHKVSKVASKHETHGQREGLLALKASGEPIRKVRLVRLSEGAS